MAQTFVEWKKGLSMSKNSDAHKVRSKLKSKLHEASNGSSESSGGASGLLEEGVEHVERGERGEEFSVRDVLLFPEERLIAPFETRTITVVPEVRSLVQRIVMHRSIAARLTLVQILVGDLPRTRAGSGSCEIFLFDVPNWAPSKMIITPEEPLRIVVRNMLDQPLKSAGSVIVGVSSVPTFEVYRARTKLFGGMGGSGMGGGEP